MKKMHKMHNVNKKKQAGFTILEIGIVMVILVSLVVAFSSGLWEKQKTSEFQIIKLWFTKNVPEAITTCRMKYGTNLQNVSAGGMATALEECGLQPETIYGTDLTTNSRIGDVTTNAAGQRVITITYPLTGMQDITEEGPTLASIIDEEGGTVIETTSFADPDLIIEVRIR